jgi:hypothetical protein
MSIHAFGAMYGGVHDVSPLFLELGVACSGWKASAPPRATESPHNGEAPFIEAALRAVKTGDIVFIKSFSPGAGLRIKGVGIVTDSRPHAVDTEAGYPVEELWPGEKSLGIGVKVRWNWPDVRDGSVHWKMPPLNDRGIHVRTGTVYEEYGPQIAEQVIALLLDPSLRQQP